MRKLAAVAALAVTLLAAPAAHAWEHCCCDAHDYGEPGQAWRGAHGARYAHEFGSDYGRGGFGRPDVRGYEAIGPGYRTPALGRHGLPRPGIVAASRASLAAVGVYAHE